MGDRTDLATIRGEGQLQLARTLELVLLDWPHGARAEPQPVTGWQEIVQTARARHKDDVWGQFKDGTYAPLDTKRPAMKLNRGSIDRQETPPVHPLPGPTADHELLATLVHAWLAALDVAQYGPYPDTDGSAERGWTVFMEWHGITIAPVWIIYGK